MTAAVIALALALAASVAGLIALAIRGQDSERRTADARVADTEKAGLLAIAYATIDTERNRADDEKGKADALNKIIMEQVAAMPAGNDRDVVLALWQAAGSAGPASADRDPRAVPDRPATRSTDGDSALMVPGE